MAFKSIPGIEGKVFVPDEGPRPRKHPCQDCYACQRCSDDRCRLCRAAEPVSPDDTTPKDRQGRAAGCKTCVCC